MILEHHLRSCLPYLSIATALRPLCVCQTAAAWNRLVLQGQEGGSKIQGFVYQKSPQVFRPLQNLTVSPEELFVRPRGWGGGGVIVPAGTLDNSDSSLSPEDVL